MHGGPAETLAVVALAIVIAPAIAGWLRLPSIIGFVLAGAVVGPYVIGLLGEGQVDALGAIGLLYLMFQAGLEIDMATFNKYRSSAVIFGLLTFTLPFLFGAAEGWLLLGFSAMASILIGSIWASHTLVTLPEVREAGISSNPAVTTVAGATVITDTLALVVLALVAGSASGTGSPAKVLATVIIGLVATALLALVVMPRIGRRFFSGSGQSRTLRFAFLLLSMAACATCAELFGIEGLVGAFVAGLGVNRLVPKTGPLMERVDFFGASLLVPAFLIYVGTKLNPAVIVQVPTIVQAALFMGALVAGKGCAALVGGRVLRFSREEAGLMFGMSVPQAAATLAATLVGYDVGLFDERTVNSVVLVVLLSIILGSLVTRSFARRIELPSGATRPLGSSVLVGLPAGLAGVEELMRVAAAVAAADDGVVLPVAVATESGRAIDEAETLGRTATRAGEAAGADVETRVRRAAAYSDAMLEAIADRHASTLFAPFGSADLSAGHVLGTEIERLGRESTVPVVAARLSAGTFKRVVLGLDRASDSPAHRYDGELATRVAASIAGTLKLPLAVSGHDEASLAGLPIPEAAEKHLGSELLMAGSELLPAGTLLVVPASLVRRYGARARGFADDHLGVSILVVAGPHRLRLLAASGANRTLMGWGGGTLTPETQAE